MPPESDISNIAAVLMDGLVARMLDAGHDPNWVHPITGLPVLHYAIARNKIGMVKLLRDKGSAVTQDRDGRWPSILAWQCECDEELRDLIFRFENAPSLRVDYEWDFEPAHPIFYKWRRFTRNAVLQSEFGSLYASGPRVGTHKMVGMRSAM